MLPEVVMSAITVRNLSDETHRGLHILAAQHGRSTETEVRRILDGAVQQSEVTATHGTGNIEDMETQMMQAARKAFLKLCEEAKNNGLQDMTPIEIETEIDAARIEAR